MMSQMRLIWKLTSALDNIPIPKSSNSRSRIFRMIPIFSIKMAACLMAVKVPAFLKLKLCWTLLVVSTIPLRQEKLFWPPRGRSIIMLKTWSWYQPMIAMKTSLWLWIRNLQSQTGMAMWVVSSQKRLQILLKFSWPVWLIALLSAEQIHLLNWKKVVTGRICPDSRFLLEKTSTFLKMYTPWSEMFRMMLACVLLITTELSCQINWFWLMLTAARRIGVLIMIRCRRLTPESTAFS